jgi:hypothetical protein
MSVEAGQRELTDGYAPGEDRPVASYAVLMSVFSALAGGFALWFRKSGRELPDRVETSDLVLMTVASHKASRLIAKDRVTTPLRAPFAEFQSDSDAGPGEVEEKARGQGLRRAIGELLICPYCLGMWTSAGFIAGLLVAPRFTRWIASVLVSFFGSEVLQIAYKRAEQSLSA